MTNQRTLLAPNSVNDDTIDPLRFKETSKVHWLPISSWIPTEHSFSLKRTDLITDGDVRNPEELFRVEYKDSKALVTGAEGGKRSVGVQFEVNFHRDLDRKVIYMHAAEVVEDVTYKVIVAAVCDLGGIFIILYILLWFVNTMLTRFQFENYIVSELYQSPTKIKEEAKVKESVWGAQAWDEPAKTEVVDEDFMQESYGSLFMPNCCLSRRE